MDQIRVALQAVDPLTYAGLTSILQSRAEFTLLRPAQQAEATVLVVSVERLAPDAIAMLRRSIGAAVPVVLIASEISETELLTVVEYRVVAVLPRLAVTPERLVDSVFTAASADGKMPPNLVDELLQHVERLQRDVLMPHGMSASGLTSREIDVLRLMADGLDTVEIAGELCYSVRTVKNVIHGLTHRLKLRNRSHAVAYALRRGAI